MLFVYQDPGKTVGDSHLLRSSDFVSRVISHTQPFFSVSRLRRTLFSLDFLSALLIVLQFSGHFISPPHHGRQTVFYSSGLSLVVLSCVHDSLLHRFFLRPFFCLREDCHFLVSRGWSLLFLTLLFLPWWSCYPSLLGYTVDLQLASIFRNG